MKIKKKFSPAQNTPALQGKLLRPRLFREKLLQVEGSSALTRATLASQRFTHFLTKRDESFTLAQLQDHDFHRRVTLLGW